MNEVMSHPYTTAAGDVFRAGFAVGLREFCVNKESGKILMHKKVGLEKAMAFGAAAAAVAICKKGAIPSIPARKDIVHFDFEPPMLLTTNKEKCAGNQH